MASLPENTNRKARRMWKGETISIVSLPDYYCTEHKRAHSWNYLKTSYAKGTFISYWPDSRKGCWIVYNKNSLELHTLKTKFCVNAAVTLESGLCLFSSGSELHFVDLQVNSITRESIRRAKKFELSELNSQALTFHEQSKTLLQNDRRKLILYSLEGKVIACHDTRPDADESKFEYGPIRAVASGSNHDFWILFYNQANIPALWRLDIRNPTKRLDAAAIVLKELEGCLAKTLIYKDAYFYVGAYFTTPAGNLRQGVAILDKFGKKQSFWNKKMLWMQEDEARNLMSTDDNAIQISA